MRKYYIKKDEYGYYKVYTSCDVKEHRDFVVLVDRGVLLKKGQYWSVEAPDDWEIEYGQIDGLSHFIVRNLYFEVHVDLKVFKDVSVALTTISKIMFANNESKKECNNTVDYYLKLGDRGDIALWRPSRVEKFDGLVALVNEEVVLLEGGYYVVRIPSGHTLELREDFGNYLFVLKAKGLRIYVNMSNIEIYKNDGTAPIKFAIESLEQMTCALTKE